MSMRDTETTSLSVVWLDREHAKLFQISEERMERMEFAGCDLFDGIIENLREVKKLLILGPGSEADSPKNRFKVYLEDGYVDLARRVVGCEYLEQPSDQQIAMMALRHFNGA